MKSFLRILFGLVWATALLAENKLDPVRQLQPSPYLTIRTAAPIVTPFNPVGSTWTSSGAYVQTGLIDPDFVTSRIVFNSQSTDGYLESGGTTSDSRVNLATSQFSVTGTGSPATTTITHAAGWQAPYLAIDAAVDAGFGSGSSRTFRISYGDGSTGFFLEWDEAAGTVTIKKATPTVSTIGTPYSGTLTPPFRIALSIANLSISAQIKYPTSEWSTLCASDFDPASTPALDPRQPARLAAANLVSFGWTTNSSGGIFKLGSVTMGYPQGINGLADQPFCFSDGTPIQHGGEQFIIFSNSYVSGSAGTAIPTAGFDIKAVDPTRTFVRTQAKVFTNNAATGITGNNSGTVVYAPPPIGKYYWLIPNYGNPAVVSDSSALKMFFYVTDSFPSGVVILQNPVAVAVPGSSTLGTGDACLRQFTPSSPWSVVYSKYAAGYSAFAPTYATIADITTCATSGNWTTVATIAPSGIAIEGIKFQKLGGVQYIIGSLLSSNTQTVYDLTLTSLGTITNPPGGPATAMHACWTVYPEGNGGQRVWWEYFDKTEYGQPNYTHGRTRFVKSTTLQDGQDFDLRFLLEAAP